MPRARRKPAALAKPTAPQTGAGPQVVSVTRAAEPAPGREQGTAAALGRATGTYHKALSVALLNDVAATLGIGKDHPQHEARSTALFALMAEFGPRDGAEGSLAASYAALHTGALQLLRRAANPAAPDELASRLRRDAVLLLRAANDAVSALQELRGRTTHQRVVVERVVVQEGGQAIVGAVAGGGPHGR